MHGEVQSLVNGEVHGEVHSLVHDVGNMVPADAVLQLQQRAQQWLNSAESEALAQLSMMLKMFSSFSARPSVDQLLFIKSVHFLLQCLQMVTLLVTESKS